MEDVRVGSVIRAVRIRRGLRQEDVASQARVGRSVVSLIESGTLERISLRNLRQVAAALGISLPIDPSWSGADMAKLVEEWQAGLVRDVVTRLAALGWEVRPECTFSIEGERGSVDVLGWHGAWRALVAIEVKTRLCDFGDLLSTMDRKGRFAPEHARLLGWRPLRFGNILVLPEATRARRTIGSSDAVFDAALPARTIEVRRWLQKPDGDLRGIWLLSNSSAGNANWGPGATPRARRPREGPDETNPATTDWALGG